MWLLLAAGGFAAAMVLFPTSPAGQRGGSAPAALPVVLAERNVAAVPSGQPLAREVSGPAQVIDGDTLDVAGVRVRLHGVDAPETAQGCLADGETWACGREATRALLRRIDGRPVTCEARDVDQYGRMVAVCRRDGQDVNAWLVAEGWALAYRRYSADYVDEEASARTAHRGMWRGEFVVPWDWRRGARLDSDGRTPAGHASPLAPPVAAATGPECRIKGNISHNGGRRIYHVPGDRDYERTRIDPGRGERWFCSEREAQAAGWRRAGR